MQVKATAEGGTSTHALTQPPAPAGLTPQQLADELGCALRTVRRHTNAWPHHKIGGRIRFLPDDVEQIRKRWIIPINQNGRRRKAS